MMQLKKDFYLGIKSQIQDINKIDFIGGGLIDQQITHGKKPYKTVGAGISVTYDTRNDAFASTKGSFMQFQYTHFDKMIYSDFNFNSILLDVRQFCAIKSNKVLALQMQFVGSFGADIPLRSLALFGGSNSIRGFYKGRYRGKQAYFLQSEYRVPIYKQIGMVAFSGLGDIANDFSNYNIPSIKYSAGGGLRYGISKNNRLNVRLDAAFTSDGKQGIYLDIGESF